MDGFLNIDKPQGITSYDAIRHLKKILPRKTRIGHLGTLDPMASGVLPIAVGKATRVIEYIADAGKAYRAEMTLGGISDTEDATGNIEYTGVSSFKEQDLMEAFYACTGTICQIPPMYSAIHFQGRRLYELAREGLEIERAGRNVDIYSITLVKIDRSYELPRITIEVTCSKGTYIRSLCRDIGVKLGTGAYLSALRRLQSGIFSIDHSCPLDSLSRMEDIQTRMVPVDYPLQHIPKIELSSPDEEQLIRNGNKLAYRGEPVPGRVRVFSSDQCLLAIAELQQADGKLIIKPQKVLAV